MAVADASKWFTRQGGEPATAFISGSDGVAAVTQTYTDFEAADALLAPLASPTLTGVPAAPTAAVGTSTTQVATTAYVVGQAVAKSTVGNLLTAAQANPEGTAGFFGLDCTLTNVADGVIGTNSLKVTASGVLPQLDFGCASYGGDATAPTIPGGPMTFDFWAKSADSSVTSLIVQFLWGDGTNAAEAVTLTSAWKHYVVTKVAPSTGPYVGKVRAYASETIGDSWQMDKIGLWQGAGGQWQDPATGVPITDLGFYTDESVGRRLFQWDANNSRWQKTYADTGLRDTAVTVANSWTIYGGYNHIRRAGNIVSLNLWLDSTSASADTVGTIPSGFRPDRTVGFGVLAPGNLIRVLQISSGGSLDATTSGTTPGAAWFVQATWVTNEAWPTTLPGSAVGSIPA